MTEHDARTWKRTVAVAVVVALVALAGCSGGGGGDGGDLGGAGGNGGDGAGTAPDSGGDGGSQSAKRFGSFYDDQGNRVVVRDASLRLRVDDFEEAFRSARATVREHGGYVGNREQTGEGEYDEGYFVVHVPAEKFATVRDAVAGLGTTLNERVKVEDFTREFQSATGRLEELKADERRLERALANASSDVEDVREQLQSVRKQRRQAQSKAGSIQRRARMSTIRVELREPASHRPADNRETLAGFSDAFYDAFYGGLATVRFLAIVVGYAIPVGFVTLVGGFGGVVVLRGYRKLLAPRLPEWRVGRWTGRGRGRTRERRREDPDRGREPRDDDGRSPPDR